MILSDGSPLRFHVDPDPTPSHGIPRPPLQPHDMIGLNAIIQRRRWRIHEPRSMEANRRVNDALRGFLGNDHRERMYVLVHEPDMPSRSSSPR